MNSEENWDLASKLYAALFVLCIGIAIGGWINWETVQDLKEDKAVLIEKVQDQFWKIQGLEQHVKQYQANACTHVVIDTQYIAVKR